MPKAKTKSFPPVKVTEEFLESTRRCAETADEYLSDYIRKAVEERNAQYQDMPTSKIVIDDPVNHPEKFRFEKMDISGGLTITAEPKIYPTETLTNVKVKKNTLQKTRMVQPLMKGGK